MMSEATKGEYIEEVFDDHFRFWATVAFGVIWLWAVMETLNRLSRADCSKARCWLRPRAHARLTVENVSQTL
ncbi:MAG: hypothetical protein ACUVSD_08870 [Thiobacillaceae bacterium]